VCFNKLTYLLTYLLTYCRSTLCLSKPKTLGGGRED